MSEFLQYEVNKILFIYEINFFRLTPTNCTTKSTHLNVLNCSLSSGRFECFPCIGMAQTIHFDVMRVFLLFLVSENMRKRINFLTRLREHVIISLLNPLINISEHMSLNILTYPRFKRIYSFSHHIDT